MMIFYYVFRFFSENENIFYAKNGRDRSKVILSFFQFLSSSSEGVSKCLIYTRKYVNRSVKVENGSVRVVVIDRREKVA